MSTLRTAVLAIGLASISPAEAKDPSTQETTVDIADYAGVMSPGKKGAKELEDMAAYYGMAAGLLIPTLEGVPSTCPGISTAVATAPGVPDPDWSKSIPVDSRILTHYKDASKREVIGHTASATLGSPNANVAFDVSKPGTEACLDRVLDQVNAVLRAHLESPMTCNFHADLLTQQPRSLGVWVNCGPRSLPNNTTYASHYYHQAGTTPKVR